MPKRHARSGRLAQLAPAAAAVALLAYLLTFPGFRYWTAAASLAFSGLTVLALLLAWALLPGPEPPDRW